MLRCCIDSYQPEWLRGGQRVRAVHGDRLAALVGSTLRHVWLLWDLDQDRWSARGPIVLDFDNERLAIDHQQFDEVSITWGSIDPGRPVGPDDPRLVWRAEPLPRLAALSGQILRRVELLVWAGDADDMANGSVAVGFTFPGRQLTVFNAMDSTGLEYDPPDSSYLRHSLT